MGALTNPGAGNVPAGPSILTRLRTQGSRLRILTETVTSPTLANQLTALLAAFPGAKWHQWEPAGRDNVRLGAQMAFSRDVQPIYRFDKADTIFSLDANFLEEDPGSVRYARDFVNGRRVRFETKQTKMNRLYMVESTPTITGGMADHRVPVKASEVEPIARYVAAKLNVAGITATDLPKVSYQGKPGLVEVVDTLWKELQANAGRSLVVAGDHQPPAVHALAYAINERLGNVGKTIDFIPSVEATTLPAGQSKADSLAQLISDVNANQVDMLIIIDSNPVFNGPADMQFGVALQKMSLKQNSQRQLEKLTVHMGPYLDETARLCQWHIPQLHYLESWSDARAYDGTISIVQPLIAPMYEGRSPHELLSVLLGQGDASNYAIVRNYWKSRPEMRANFETSWRKALNDGVVANTAAMPVGGLRVNTAAIPAASAPPNGEIEIIFRRDQNIWDGRFANNGWLLELPRTMTKLTWDNAALMSVKTAQALGVEQEQVVQFDLGPHTEPVRIVAWPVPGHPDDSITLPLGFGRTEGGKLATGTGVNVYALRNKNSLYISAAKRPTVTGEIYTVSSPQHHWSIDITKSANGQETLDTVHQRDMDILHVMTLPEAKNPEPTAGGKNEGGKNEGAAKENGEENVPSLFPHEWPDDIHAAPASEAEKQKPYQTYGNGTQGYQWGMVIDLTACIGCNACTIGCQAENNIPIVGKDQVHRGRSMHWIRIDRYYKGHPDNPSAYFQPVPCMHCEKAPCELVCPVEATSHSLEGINEQTYNRCVGTKYCSNNCPYKVRRFNFLQWSDQDSPNALLVANPDVTVRARGVMEKCTYCVQRVNAARVQAEKEDRRIKDGELVPACQQVCPTEAIIFGNIADATTEVSRLRKEQHNYSMLAGLNTYPRTTYLARLRNPDEGLEKMHAADDSEATMTTQLGGES
jgi:molybdopterin-containing oxidoreductase family iron-sulfur binding subunit